MLSDLFACLLTPLIFTVNMAFSGLESAVIPVWCCILAAFCRMDLNNVQKVLYETYISAEGGTLQLDCSRCQYMRASTSCGFPAAVVTRGFLSGIHIHQPVTVFAAGAFFMACSEAAKQTDL